MVELYPSSDGPVNFILFGGERGDAYICLSATGELRLALTIQRRLVHFIGCFSLFFFGFASQSSVKVLFSEFNAFYSRCPAE